MAIEAGAVSQKARCSSKMALPTVYVDCHPDRLLPDKLAI